MIVEDGKIVEATELELFLHWEEHWFMFMDFDTYILKMKDKGVRVIDN